MKEYNVQNILQDSYEYRIGHIPSALSLFCITKELVGVSNPIIIGKSFGAQAWFLDKVVKDNFISSRNRVLKVEDFRGSTFNVKYCQQQLGLAAGFAVGYSFKKEDLSAFTIEEIQFLTNVTGFGAISIENANFYRRAITDRMTKLYNHHQFEKTLEEYIQKAQNGDIAPFSLVMFDIDHFKSFNDNYGHLQGDIIIKDIARMLLSEVRDCDYPARYGGEEFIVILPDTSLDDAEIFASRLRKSIESHEFPGENRTFQCTVSLGVAEYSKKYVKNNTDMVGYVDKALYTSKENGRNQVTKFIYKK